jgi:hypothetical protein
MPKEPWLDDEQPPSPPAPRWRWWHIVGLSGVFLAAVAGVIVGLFPEKVVGKWHDWHIKQLRKEILDGNLSPEALRDDLVDRSDGFFYACKLSEDSDPRVRVAVIDTLVADAMPARKREPGEPPNDTGPNMTGAVEGALTHLIDDPDPGVRKKAIRAVSSIALTSRFRDRLLDILDSGPVDERLIVCEYLAHWDGSAVCQTFANPRQPREVRLAALKSAERWGWAEVVNDDRVFVEKMKQVQAEKDEDLQRAATEAMKHRRDGAGE